MSLFALYDVFKVIWIDSISLRGEKVVFKSVVKFNLGCVAKLRHHVENCWNFRHLVLVYKHINVDVHKAACDNDAIEAIDNSALVHGDADLRLAHGSLKSSKEESTEGSHKCDENCDHEQVQL